MITYSLDTIKPMIDLLSDKENLSYELVDRILEYKDYQFEIERYKERISKDEYIDYLLSGDADNECLKLHDNLYRDLYNDVQKYQKGIDELVIFLKSGALNKLLYELSKCFYNGIKLCDFHFIFTLGFGHSFGYVYKNIIHIDFLELIYTGIENVMKERVFLHEMHHIVFNTIPKNINSLEEEFILSFASEGLALKYVNNAKGNYSKPLKDEDMKGVDEFSINYLNNDFENTYFHFVDTIYKIRNNQMNKADLNKDKKSFWLNQKIDGKVVLKQSRYYSLGNELGGLLHDFYGIEKVYEIV